MTFRVAAPSVSPVVSTNSGENNGRASIYIMPDTGVDESAEPSAVVTSTFRAKSVCKSAIWRE